MRPVGIVAAFALGCLGSALGTLKLGPSRLISPDMLRPHLFIGDSVKRHPLATTSRGRIRRAFQLYWLDVFVIVAVCAVTMSALMRWPDKAVPEIAIPVAFLITFMMWRARY